MGFYNYFYSSSTSPEVLYNIEKRNEKFNSELPLEQQIYDAESGKTWATYIEDSVLEQIGALVYAYNRGVEADIGVFERQRERIDANIASIRAEAKKMKISADRYTSLVYGDYVGIKTVENILEMSCIAQNYYEYYRCNVSLTEDEYNSYLNGETDRISFAEYIACKITFYSLQELDDFVRENNGFSTLTAENFSIVIDEISTDFLTDLTEFSGHRSECFDNPKIADWAFAKNRKAGDITFITDEENLFVYILMAHSDTVVKTDITCSARELTLRKNDFETPESFENTKNLIVQKLNQSSNPEYDMAVLCDIYMNNDTDSNSGGLVTCIEKSDSAANAWLYESDRQNGEFTVLSNNDNYYILMYSDKKESWRFAAESAYASDKLDKATKQVSVKKLKAFKHTGSVWTENNG